MLVLLPGGTQSAPGGQASAGGNSPMTVTACIDSANPISAEAQCKADRLQRSGGNLTGDCIGASDATAVSYAAVDAAGRMSCSCEMSRLV